MSISHLCSLLWLLGLRRDRQALYSEGGKMMLDYEGRTIGLGWGYEMKAKSELDGAGLCK